MRKQLYIYIMLVVYGFVLMLFCTKSSPFFMFNDWYDANVYYSMGKGLMNGKVPFTDLIENKGPFLYLIYGLAWLLDNTGFTGVYIFQSLFVSMSVIYVYRLSQLFGKNVQISFLVAICSPIPMLIYDFYANSFNFGGGGPDEFCRGLLVVSLFYFTLYYAKPGEYKFRHTMIQGVLFTCVALLRFNLTAFWAGFLLAVAVEEIYKKRYVYLVKHIAWFFTGIFITALPYFVYALATRSLGAFYDNYFVFNALYTNPAGANLPGLAVKAFVDAVSVFSGHPALLLLLIAGLVFVFTTLKPGFCAGYSMSLILSFISIYFTSRQYPYVHIPATVFVIFGLAAAGAWIGGQVKKRRFNRVECLVVIGLVMAFTIGMNKLVTYELFFGKKPAAPQQVAEAIWSNTRSDTPTMLEINGLDSGVYTASGIVPSEPYFHVFNVSDSAFPQVRGSQREAVEEGRTEFLVFKNEDPDARPDGYNIDKHYDLIFTAQGIGFQKGMHFLLFQIRD